MATRSTDKPERAATDEPYITAKELARRLGVHQSTIKRMRDAGTIKPVPIGNSGRYLYSQVRAQIEAAAQ